MPTDRNKPRLLITTPTYRLEPETWASLYVLWAKAKEQFRVDLYLNMSQMGYREAPGLTFLRDPYSKAGNGQVVLHYYFRTVYKVLQAEAVGYGQHATS